MMKHLKKLEDDVSTWPNISVHPHQFNNAKLVRIPSANQQINLMLPFSGLTDVPDLLLQFALGHGPVGPWPPYAYLMFGTLSGRI